MNSLLDIIAGVRDLFEPGDEIAKDETGAKPLEHADETLYVYADPARCREVPFETGPSARQEFTLLVEIAAPSSEEALRERDLTVSEYLDDKLGRYMSIVRNNRVTALWHHLQASQRPPSRVLGSRGLMLELTGYRIV